MALRSRVAAIFAKIESTYNTDPVTAAADAIRIENLNLQSFTADTLSSNELRAFFGGRTSFPVNLGRSMTCDVVHGLNGGGADTAPQIGTLFQACGAEETVNAATSVVYTPVTASADQNSLWIDAHRDGNHYELGGVRGNFTCSAPVNDFMRFGFDFISMYKAPIAIADPAVDYTGWDIATPVGPIATATATIGGNGHAIRNFQFDAGQQNVKVTAYGSGGSETINLVDRQSTCQITIDSVLISSETWEEDARLGTTKALQLIHAPATGATITFDAPTAQISNITFGEEDNIQTTTLDFVLLPGVSGNDEWSWTFIGA